MAEAVVDGSPMSRFFCHKCSVEIERLLPDYTCPNCASGFIEKLENAEDDHDVNTEISSEDFHDIDFDAMHMDLDRPQIQLSDFDLEGTRRRDRRRHHLTRPRPITHRSRTVLSHENLFHELLINLTGVGMQRPLAATGRQPPVLFLGNPGDYVWGRDGLDTIVTELLNQLDGSGPPPLPRNQIDEIPTTAIVQSNIDCKLQCSICWEDFMLSEIVRQLPCKHLFHTPCIVPWLELHGTCPICRQNLGDQNAADASQDEVGASLAAIFRVANQFDSRNSNSSSSTSSTSTNSDSSNDPSNEV